MQHGHSHAALEVVEATGHTADSVKVGQKLSK
jgi:hypothetical protein